MQYDSNLFQVRLILSVIIKMGVIKLSDFYGVSIDYLLDQTDDPKRYYK